VKTEHVESIVRLIRRMQPADLILPVGALLVSAGLQRLVDREDRQRQRLVALNELVDDHRQTLEASGVELPVDRFGDEVHPLDIEGAIQTVLARVPTEPAPAEEVRPRPRRALRRLAILGIAGASGLLVWGRGYAKTYGQEGTLSGFLTAWHGPEVDRGEPTSSSISDLNENSSGEKHPGVCNFCGHDHDPNTSPHPDGPPAAGIWERDGVIGKGEPPLEECGWPSCDWTSDATRSDAGQQIQAAIHRNKCLYRPAGAQVAE
jgi:hypothetical protein